MYQTGATKTTASDRAVLRHSASDASGPFSSGLPVGLFVPLRLVVKLFAVSACAIVPAACMTFGYLSGYNLVGILSLYGFFAIFNLALKSLFASLTLRASQSEEPYEPFVSIVVPVYNESPEALEKCLRSLASQGYREYEIIVVDDGSTAASYEGLIEKIQLDAASPIEYRRFSVNKGKRRAMYEAFSIARGDVILNTDSDTVLAPDAVSQLVKPLAQKVVAAVTGNVSVANADKSLLTKLIAVRHWFAFNQERAAQSYFGVVNCVSGPLGAYKREVIDECKDQWLNQRFLGKTCTFGDDRHLTNLVLAQGLKVEFVSQANASTTMPSSLIVWIKQQTRWTRSFYREFLWTLRSLVSQHIYLCFDLMLQLVLPIFLAVNVSIILYKALHVSALYFLMYPLLIMLMGGLRSLFGYVHKQTCDVFLMPLYGLLNLVVLLPVRLYALLTVFNNKWGTR